MLTITFIFSNYSTVPVVPGVYVFDKLETMNSSVVPISNYNQSPYTNLDVDKL